MPPYRVIVAPEAIADLEALHAYISADSPDNAARTVQRILDAVAGPGDMPQRYPLVRTRRNFPYQLRKVVVRPYKVFYSIEGDAVHVRTIRHGSRRPWP